MRSLLIAIVLILGGPAKADVGDLVKQTTTFHIFYTSGICIAK